IDDSSVVIVTKRTVQSGSRSLIRTAAFFVHSTSTRQVEFWIGCEMDFDVKLGTGRSVTATTRHIGLGLCQADQQRTCCRSRRALPRFYRNRKTLRLSTRRKFWVKHLRIATRVRFEKAGRYRSCARLGQQPKLVGLLLRKLGQIASDQQYKAPILI